MESDVTEAFFDRTDDDDDEKLRSMLRIFDVRTRYLPPHAAVTVFTRWKRIVIGQQLRCCRRKHDVGIVAAFPKVEALSFEIGFKLNLKQRCIEYDISTIQGGMMNDNEVSQHFSGITALPVRQTTSEQDMGYASNFHCCDM